jgi:RHS repeat-associated protein
MMERNRVALLVYVLLLFDLGILCAATGPKFQPSGSGDPGIGRYLVTLSDDASEDAAAMKKELATLYGARLEADVSSDVRQFTVTMMPARARLLSADPRVNGVAEVPLTAEAPPAAPASVPPARRLTPQPSGYGDNGQSGTYTYDGAGNITAIGADTYVYDTAQRLVRSVTRGVEEDYTYDAFGNRKSATGAINCLGQTTCAQPVTVDSTTNHLTTINGGAVTYDAAGNIATISGSPGAVYTYDSTGMMIQATVGSDDRQFLYTADDERIAVKQGVSWTWMLRDLNGKVLREFTSLESGPNLAMTNWQWVKDYVWRDGLLLATTTPAGTLHYHLDHLGTPRLVTDNNGVKVAEHAYYPFGAEINLTPHETPEEAMKFTGHERDIVAGDGHTLDYMHARYYSPTAGRFLSVDSALDPSKTLPNPQAWNRYAYVRNNPMRFTDPTGKYTCSGSKDDCRAIDTAVADLTAAASKLPKDSSDRTRLNNVIVFLGAADTDNGVHVVVGSGTLPGAAAGTRTVDGITTIGLDLKADSAYASAHNVPLGAELAGTLTHEAQHGLDERRYGNPASRAQEKLHELSGYTTEAGTWRGMRVSAPSHIWTRETGFNPHAVEDWAETATQIWCSSPGAPCN